MTERSNIQRRARAGGRWQGRPFVSRCLKTLTLLGPLACALGVSFGLGAILPEPSGAAGLAIHWLVRLALSTVALLGADRAARRLLPLTLLFQLSLAFPEEAPSRFAVARRASNLKDVEARIERARIEGIDDEPTRAAVDMLALVAAVEGHDRATRGHSERVRILADLIGKELGLPAQDRDRLRWVALLHDVGKLAVSSKILNKPGKLTEREWEQIRRHPEEGRRLVGPLRAWLGEWASAIEQHHERFDGNGYPRRLSGEQISLGARIVAVADVFETMTARRPYRRAVSAFEAQEELVRCAGTQFDPSIVRAFLQVSVGRQTRVAAPLAWLAQASLGGVSQAAALVGRTVAGAAAAAGVLGIAVVPPVGATGADTARPRAVVERGAASADARFQQEVSHRRSSGGSVEKASESVETKKPGEPAPDASESPAAGPPPGLNETGGGCAPPGSANGVPYPDLVEQVLCGSPSG